MKRLLGVLFFVAGVVATFIYGMDAYQSTESVKLFGTKITLSQADWNPVIISGGVLLVGLVLLLSGESKGRKKARR